MKIGFIGLGIMGRPMAKNLIKAGHELVVCDFNKAAVEDLVSCGAKSAANGAEMAKEVDVIITMVQNSPQVRAAVLGENGVAETAKPGFTLIDMSSIDPVESKKIGEELAKKGCKMLDAPVSGGEPKAIDGTLSVMVGGEKEDFDKFAEGLQEVIDYIRENCLSGEAGTVNSVPQDKDKDVENGFSDVNFEEL